MNLLKSRVTFVLSRKRDVVRGVGWEEGKRVSGRSSPNASHNEDEDVAHSPGEETRSNGGGSDSCRSARMRGEGEERTYQTGADDVPIAVLDEGVDERKNRPSLWHSEGSVWR